MRDIAKCIGAGCEVKRECLRFTTPSSLNQSWVNHWLHFSFKPATGCQFIVPLTLKSKSHVSN